MNEKRLKQIEDIFLHQPYMGGVEALQQNVIRELVDTLRDLNTYIEKANKGLDSQQKLLEETLVRTQKAKAERDEARDHAARALNGVSRLTERAQKAEQERDEARAIAYRLSDSSASAEDKSKANSWEVK